MILDKKKIKKEGVIYKAIKLKKKEKDLIFFIVERYLLYPDNVIESIGLQNTIDCHVYYLDYHYNHYLQNKKVLGGLIKPNKTL